MADAKTRPTQAAAAGYLAAIADPARRDDCERLLALMRKATKQEPVMWGPAIVGFGRYRYSYDSGHSGEACAVGFASRKSDISVYLSAAGARQAELLARLGRHKMGKACMSIRRLADVDLAVLERLVADAYAEVRRRHPD